MSSWTCDGVPKDGKPHLEQSPPGAHEPYENFGDDCVICRLKREAITGSGSGKFPIVPIATGAVVLGLLGLGGFFLPKLLSKQVPSSSIPINSPSTPATSSSVSTGNGSVTGAVVQTFKTLADVPNVPSMTVKYGGSTSFAPLRTEAIVKQILQGHPNFQLVYTEPPAGAKPGSGSGIEMLINSQISVAQSSRSIRDEEFQRAQTRGFGLEAIPIALDGIALYTSQQLSLPSLSRSQVKDIYTGKVTNWKQVGGPDLVIRPFSRDPKDSGTPEFFEESVMAKEPFAASVQPYTRDTTDTIRKVSAAPGGIGYATASEVCNQRTIKPLPISDGAKPAVPPCNGAQVNLQAFSKAEYPITRRLFAVIRRDGKLDEQAGVAYANLLLSDEGQKIVEQAGLAPLRTIP
jgi:phosphate transport system substrate-binding protein